MRGYVFRRCWCREPQTRKPYRKGKCPKLRDSTHGRYWFRIDVPASKGQSRRQRQRGPFLSRIQAEHELAIALAKIGAVGYAYSSTITFAKYLKEEWLPSKVALTTSSWKAYEEVCDLYLIPAWGHLKLNEITRRRLNELVVELEKINRDEEEPSELLRRLLAVRAYRKPVSGAPARRSSTTPLSAARIKKIMACASSALGDAVTWELLEHNPAQHLTMPRVIKQRPMVWTEARARRWRETGKKPSAVMVWNVDQVRDFLRFVSQERLFPLYRLAIVRGPRRGELLALEWPDVDLENASVLIREACQGNDKAGEPKSEAGYRYIDLDATTVDVLRAWKDRQAQERAAAGELWEKNDLVFTTELGSPLRPGNVTAQMTELVRRSGLPPVTLHGLRHESVSLSLAANVRMEVISRTLGHAKPSFTSDFYGCLMPHQEREAAEVTARYLDVEVAVKPSRGLEEAIEEALDVD
ncbi:tyrosine-type recombinase/integrase [Nocardiopsis tropica]|uniref:Tyrosine-type recombinase/integrase n=1 Tax=Nocardiopsis tropica TaxID=109330 RepID=A0ABU7KMR4_9ACTN|nr:tyrosine-type recombinase/integrase [Nocardiopsis umidischolae]MEE2050583.1 tyrosine-type recombinase/integrase [Nocardiopsis umidischolae]